MIHARHVLPAAAMAFACFGAQAQSQAAGLWEQVVTMSSPGGQIEAMMAGMQQQLAAMPPEQRRQVEQMLAKNNVTAGAGGITHRMCITPEQAARPAEPKLGDGCTQQVTQRSANRLKMTFQCTRPQPYSGEFDVVFSGDKAYTGSSVVTGQVAGMSQQLKATVVGKWLGAACGDVKPMSLPAR